MFAIRDSKTETIVKHSLCNQVREANKLCREMNSNAGKERFFIQPVNIKR